MSNQGKTVDFQNLLSLADDLIAVLTTKKDGEALIQSCDGASTIFSSFLNSSRDVRSSTQDDEKKIDFCKREAEKVKSETTVTDAELTRVQNEAEQMAKKTESVVEELSTGVNSKLEEHDNQKAYVEEKKLYLQERKKDMLTGRNLLSMAASISQIIPDLDDQETISGRIVHKNKKRVENFEFPKSDSSFDPCNQIWKQASN